MASDAGQCCLFDPDGITCAVSFAAAPCRRGARTDEMHPIVDGFLAMLEAKRPHVAGHARRVSTYAVRLATQYGLAPDVIDSIRVGALLHDLGKLLVPMRILTKPGRLTHTEWVELRAHPDKGISLLERGGLDPDTLKIILHHHERIDGRGYPDGMAGREIPWAVRIVGVMDALDALTSPREYREALSVDAARALIAREAGTRFCPWVVSGLLSLPTALLVPGTADGGGVYLPDGFPQFAAAAATEAWAAACGVNT
jgi:putative nucleotidyltransferase with HDIG domain